VNTLIGSHKRQAVKNLEALLAQTTGRAKMHHPQGGFVNQLQRQTSGKLARGWAGPARQQIPGAQTQVFRSQQPQADKVARDLIGQQLTDAAFDAEGGDLFSTISSQRAKGLDFHDWTLGVELIEFFFAIQTGQ
jgi:hypothetical protein